MYKPNYTNSPKIIRAFSETPGFFIVGPILTTSGYLNPIYPDSRRTFSDPKLLQIIIDETKKFIKTKKIKFDVVCGGATAGIMLSSPLALQLGKPQIYVRQKPKAGGMKLAVEGAFKKGQRVLLIDDATAGGAHKLDFVRNLKQVGLRTVAIVVPFARNRFAPGDHDWLKDKLMHGITYQCFCDLNDIKNYSVKKHLMTPLASEIIDWYMNDPDHWHKNKTQLKIFNDYKNLKKRASKTNI